MARDAHLKRNALYRQRAGASPTPIRHSKIEAAGDDLVIEFGAAGFPAAGKYAESSSRGTARRNVRYHEPAEKMLHDRLDDGLRDIRDVQTLKGFISAKTPQSRQYITYRVFGSHLS
jgi:hypothetical protein